MSKDFFYDETTKDLTLTAGNDLKFTENIIDFTIQKIEKVLGFLLGEWYLDITEGIPYIAQNNNDRDDRTQNILVKDPDLAWINSVFVLAINGIDTIEKTISLTTVLNTATREMVVTFEALLTNGQLLEEQLNIGAL